MTITYHPVPKSQRGWICRVCRQPFRGEHRRIHCETCGSEDLVPYTCPPPRLRQPLLARLVHRFTCEAVTTVDHPELFYLAITLGLLLAAMMFGFALYGLLDGGD